jgi:hypothetical protein
MLIGLQGKTSLLMALLGMHFHFFRKFDSLIGLIGEMHFVPSGPTSWFNLPRAKGVSYAAQESWVQNVSYLARSLDVNS